MVDDWNLSGQSLLQGGFLPVHSDWQKQSFGPTLGKA
jgi:hypothetical protein